LKRLTTVIRFKFYISCLLIMVMFAIIHRTIIVCISYSDVFIIITIFFSTGICNISSAVYGGE
jgi:hypothetical protein